MSTIAAKTASYALRTSLSDRLIAAVAARMPRLSDLIGTMPVLAAGVVMTATLTQVF